jgi:serine protease inhibitor
MTAVFALPSFFRYTVTGGECLYVSNVKKAFIEVTEKGSEAAAATGIVMFMECLIEPSNPQRFVCNRLFLFAIHSPTVAANGKKPRRCHIA